MAQTTKLVGYKANQEEYQMVVDLINHYNKSIKVKGVEVTASHILRMAVESFHKEKIKTKK